MQQVYITVEEIRKNKIKSVLLVALLALMILGISWLIGYMNGDALYGLGIGAVVTIIVIPIQILTAKAAILSMTKGQKLDPNDPRQHKLQNIVEGLSISAGFTRVPDVYLVPSEVPNAFASGTSEKNAFIGVTQGLLNMLDDQELAGVIGHEISHIAHRDIMLSQLAVALVTIILILAAIASRMAFFSGGRSRSRNSRGSGDAGLVLVVIALAALLLRPLAMLIANLIQMSISRKREYAADAYSVRLNGYAEGLARALEKIGSVKTYDKKASDSLGGSQLKALYIHFPNNNVSGLFSTHPPIEERINRLRNMY